MSYKSRVLRTNEDVPGVKFCSSLSVQEKPPVISWVISCVNP